jgi:post-segregation antitoxin (ccd killing protein)
MNAKQISARSQVEIGKELIERISNPKLSRLLRTTFDQALHKAATDGWDTEARELIERFNQEGEA